MDGPALPSATAEGWICSSDDGGGLTVEDFSSLVMFHGAVMPQCVLFNIVVSAMLTTPTRCDNPIAVNPKSNDNSDYTAMCIVFSSYLWSILV